MDTAEALRAGARSLLRAAGPLTAEYRAVRTARRSGAARTQAMEDLVDTARRLAALRRAGRRVEEAGGAPHGTECRAP